MLKESVNPTHTKNRYKNAPRGADYVIDQHWESYSLEEHDRWNRLFFRQKEIIQNRACKHFINAVSELKLSSSGIPHMGRLSERLHALTGWQVVPVAELVPDDVFFDHLANKRFPTGAFIRPEAEFDYLQEPDVFHDIFGHVPMLADPEFANFMQAYGKGGQRAMALGQLKNLARLYWYTVEFGLVKEAGELRIFGAGILSSPKETVFSLVSDSPHRIAFNLERVMLTDYIIDDFQKTYFVVESFKNFVDTCYTDFGNTYEKIRDRTAVLPDVVLENDVIIQRGNLAYFSQ